MGAMTEQSAEAVRAGDARACGQCGRTGTASREVRGTSILYSWPYDGAERYVCRGPCLPDAELTDEQLERFKAEWERKRHGHPKLLTPLPRRVRLRLAIEGAVNHVATWLACRGHYDAAERLWRACGMWSK